ncbi:hypothetical protein BJV82DRAFT_578008 [Fennellomyces sp. T-0311]|nr:hypothetical protein BJV82DRAFT_578008 [Fennellomyces sp. T-0311]
MISRASVAVLVGQEIYVRPMFGIHAVVPFMWLVRLRMKRNLHAALGPKINRRVKAAKEDPNWERPIPGTVSKPTEPRPYARRIRGANEAFEWCGVNPNGEAEDVFTFYVLNSIPILNSIIRESLHLRIDAYELGHTKIGSEKTVLSNGIAIPLGMYRTMVMDSDTFIDVRYNHRYYRLEKYTDGVMLVVVQNSIPIVGLTMADHLPKLALAAWHLVKGNVFAREYSYFPHKALKVKAIFSVVDGLQFKN